MARWASVKQVAEHLSMTELAVRQQIARETSLGLMFKRAVGMPLRADLDEIDAFIKGENS